MCSVEILITHTNMYTNMSAKKRKIDRDQSQRRLCWGSGSLTVTGDLIPGSAGHTLLSSLSNNLFDV